MIKYSGVTITVTTFTAGASVDAMITNFENALAALGWTAVSGSGTTDLVMRSRLSPQGYGVRVRLRKSVNAGNNNIDLLLQDYGGLIAQRVASDSTGVYLAYAAGRTFNIIGTPFYFWVFPSGAAVAKGFVAAGVPRVHDFLTAGCTNCAFLYGMNSAYNGGLLECWRHGAFVTNGAQAHEAIWNNTRVYASTSNYTGAIILAPELGIAYPNPSVSAAVQFAGTDRDLATPALIGWGLASMNNEAQCVGQLWDACATRNRFATDATDTFDGHDWKQIMNPVGGSYSAYGSLWVCTS
jgi:hypothetical protein